MAGFKRKVFYVGGFDPRGVRFYYQLAREQIGRWASKTGQAATISPRRTLSPIRTDWTIANPDDGVITDYSFLRWEDLVQRAWIRSPAALGRRAIATYARHRRHLDLKTLKTFPRGPLVTLFYPIALTVLLPVLVALPVFLLGLLALPWWLSLILALAIGVAVATPMLVRIHAPWLLRFFVFNDDLSRPGGIPAIDERLDRFAELIDPVLDDPVYDEILLLTHSNGSILAVSLVAKLLAKRGTLPERFTLVTLGHCIPLVACRRDAAWFHEDLRRLARSDFRWIDIGSPPDGAAYSGVNPMTIVGSESRPRIQFLNPRFYRFYDAQTYHKGLSNKYEIHFDYLRVGDTVSPLDYGSLTARARPIDAAVADFRTIP